MGHRHCDSSGDSARLHRGVKMTTYLFEIGAQVQWGDPAMPQVGTVRYYLRNGMVAVVKTIAGELVEVKVAELRSLPTGEVA